MRPCPRFAQFAGRSPRSGTLLVVVDTNVLVSGLAFGSAGPSRAILRAIVTAKVRPVVSPPLEAEYHRVLARPQFVARHGMNGSQLKLFLRAFLVRAVINYPRSGPVRAPDADDQMLWDLLSAIPECVLVTGERRLLGTADFPERVFNPRQFVEQFGFGEA